MSTKDMRSPVATAGTNPRKGITMTQFVAEAVNGAISDARMTDTVRPYQNLVDSIIANVEAGIEAACETLVEAGVNLGASETQVEEVLVQAGLRKAPEPEVEEEATAEEEDDSVAPRWAQSLIEKVDSLTSFARRNGYNG